MTLILRVAILSLRAVQRVQWQQTVALSAAVRASLQKTYSSSKVSGDGQVVVIAFTDNITYEILPAFLNDSGGYTFPDLRRRLMEIMQAQTRDGRVRTTRCGVTNLVQLGRMVRAWRDRNTVSMNGMLIDTLAYQFMESGHIAISRSFTTIS